MEGLSQMPQLFHAAKARNVVEVKLLLSQGLVPNCHGIHKTCCIAKNDSETNQKDSGISFLSSILSEEGIFGFRDYISAKAVDIISLLKSQLNQQLEINLQQGVELEFLSLALEEMAAHTFILAQQREIAAEVAGLREQQIKTQLADADKALQNLNIQKQELLKQQQAAEGKRKAQSQLHEQQRLEIARQQEAALALAQKQALDKVAKEQEKINARLEFDKPYGGPRQVTLLRSRLHIATLNKNVGEINNLLAAGATADIKDKLGHTPLWYAVFEVKNLNCINALIKGGAIVSPEMLESIKGLRHQGDVRKTIVAIKAPNATPQAKAITPAKDITDKRANVGANIKANAAKDVAQDMAKKRDNVGSNIKANAAKHSNKAGVRKR